MAVKVAGGNNTAGQANVDANYNLNVNAPLAAVNAGFVTATGEVTDGLVGVARQVRPLDVSPDYKLRAALDQIMWMDTFCHAQLNLSKYKYISSTMTTALAGGKMVMNNGNSLASGAYSVVNTFRTFYEDLSYGLYADFELGFSALPVANNVNEFGMGFAAGVAVPTDGVFFRLNASGVLQGVANNNGAETSCVLNFTYIINQLNHFLVVLFADRAEFWINDEMYGRIICEPGTANGPTMSNSLPLLIRSYNSAVTSSAQQLQVATAAITKADMNTQRSWPTVMAGMGLSMSKLPDGVAAGQSQNYVNSTVPASATLSNTAAGYTTLGGQWQFVAVAGAETDYALFGFQVPAAAANLPGRNFIMTGVHIEAYNMVIAVATTPTILQWALGLGASAVSLATADSTTAGTRAPRKIALGAQYLPIGAAVGAVANAIDVNFKESPEMVEAGTWVHLILKMPVATATSTEVIRGTAAIFGYYE